MAGQRRSDTVEAVLVRPMTPEDHAVVLAANAAEVPAVGPLDEAGLAHLIAQCRHALVATVEDQLAGFCLTLDPGADYASVNYAWFCQRYEDFIYLDRVVVTPAARGKGVGRALYQQVIDEVTATWFCAEVNLRPRNDVSLAFHERLGFVEVGQQDTPSGLRVAMLVRQLR